MANNGLTGVQLAATLAEEVYRRDKKDVPVTLTELGMTARDFDQLSGFQRDDGRSSGGGVYYYTNRGFVGEVLVKDGIFYVVFRGTDSAESFPAGIGKALPTLNQTATDGSRLSDLGDWSNNLLMGKGIGQQTQLDDALALTRAAIAAAGGDRSKVVVVGQSAAEDRI